MPPPQHAAEHVHLEPGRYAQGVVHGIAVYVWSDSAREQDARRLTQLAQVLVQDQPDGISSLHWVLQGAGLPTSDARTGLSRIIERYGAGIAHVAVVLEGAGFWAGAYRGLVTSIARVAAADIVSVAHDLHKQLTAPLAPRVM